MRAFPASIVFGLIGFALVGCSIPTQSHGPATGVGVVNSSPQPVVQAGYFAGDNKPGEELPPPKNFDKESATRNGNTEAVGLQDLVGLTLERNPRLAQAGYAVKAAQGRATQAGLYPNPTVTIRDDELGDRTGRAGIITAPYISQEIVTADKLKLSQSAALREVDQATLSLRAERYGRLTAVRQGYFEVLTLQRRLGILEELVKLASQTTQTTKKLMEAKEATRLDLLQLETDRERYRAEKEATRRELPAAMRRLAASVGIPTLPWATVAGSLEAPVPDYDIDVACAFLMQTHPEVRSAQIGVERARLLLQRAQAEPVPNVTVGAGYIYQHENRSHDAAIGVSLPVPVWNRNEGNIAAAQAQVGEAQAQVGRAQTDLAERLAAAFGQYASARQRAEQYRTEILPRARESYQLSLKAYQGGQFEYLRVLQTQRAVAEANLEYNRALGEMWRAASEIAGFMLEDEWPCPSPTAPTPRPVIDGGPHVPSPEGGPFP